MSSRRLAGYPLRRFRHGDLKGTECPRGTIVDCVLVWLAQVIDRPREAAWWTDRQRKPARLDDCDAREVHICGSLRGYCRQTSGIAAGASWLSAQSPPWRKSRPLPLKISNSFFLSGELRCFNSHIVPAAMLLDAASTSWLNPEALLPQASVRDPAFSDSGMPQRSQIAYKSCSKFLPGLNRSHSARPNFNNGIRAQQYVQNAWRN